MIEEMPLCYEDVLTAFESLQDFRAWQEKARRPSIMTSLHDLMMMTVQLMILRAWREEARQDNLEPTNAFEN